MGAMPYQIRKAGRGYTIRKALPDGHTRTVGHSTTRAKAQRSVNARNAAAHGATLGNRKR